MPKRLHERGPLTEKFQPTNGEDPKPRAQKTLHLPTMHKRKKRK